MWRDMFVLYYKQEVFFLQADKSRLFQQDNDVVILILLEVKKKLSQNDVSLERV